MAEDWDTLILLDACRYDMFAERVPFDERRAITTEPSVTNRGESDELVEERLRSLGYRE